MVWRYISFAVLYTVRARNIVWYIKYTRSLYIHSSQICPLKARRVIAPPFLKIKMAPVAWITCCTTKVLRTEVATFVVKTRCPRVGMHKKFLTSGPNFKNSPCKVSTEKVSPWKDLSKPEGPKRCPMCPYNFIGTLKVHRKSSEGFNKTNNPMTYTRLLYCIIPKWQ